MVERVRIDFERLQGECLVLLYSRFMSDKPGMSIAQIAGKFGLARNPVRLVIRDEIKRGRCQENYRGSELRPGRFHVSSLAIGAALAAFDGSDETKVYVDPDDRKIELTQDGVVWVNELPDGEYEACLSTVVPESILRNEVPASDRTVTLNHNQPDYQDAVGALDKVVEAFRDDHRLDNELGREKGALLKALEAGRELLNDTEVNVRIGTALLIEPLQRLVVKYEKELIAALASAAIPLILKMFGVG